MVAGSLEIEMLMNLARLQQDMNKAQQMIGGSMKSIEGAIGSAKTALGVLGIGLSGAAIIAFAKHTLDALSRMKEFGQETGTSAEAISRFEAPARMAGSSLEAVSTAIFRMSKASMEAKDPTSKAAQALSAIGISTAQLKGLKPDEMFELVSRQLVKYGDGMEKNAVMQELFSRSGREMNRVTQEIAQSGTLVATVTNEEAEQANRLANQMVELKMTSEKFWRGVMSEGVPAMNAILKAFIDGHREAGIYAGTIDAVSAAMDRMLKKSPQVQLAMVNQEIEVHKKSVQDMDAIWAKLGMRAKDETRITQAKVLNEILERRKGIEHAIHEADIKAQDERAMRGQTPAKAPPKFDPNRGKDSAKEVELYTRELQKLELELQKVNGQTELEKINYELTKGSLRSLTVEHGNLLRAKAMELDVSRAMIAAAASLATAIDYEIQKRREQAEASGAFHVANQENLRQMEFEITLLGKTEKQKRTAIALRQLEMNYIKLQVGVEGDAYEQNRKIFEFNKRALQEGIVSQTALDDLDELLNPDRVIKFGEAWQNSFGAAGKAIADLMNSMEDYKKKEREVAAMRAAAAKIADPTERAKAQMAINEKAADQQIGHYADMAGAAKGFFKEGSRGYKALQAAETAFRAFQLASDLMKGISAAAVAIANQAQGDPYTAWARMAMMAAAMAALGFAVAGAGGGGGAAHVAGSVAMQERQGTGTVFGDSSAKSESITKALEILRENSSSDLLYTSRMLTALLNIESSMSGMAAAVVRSGITGAGVKLPGSGGGNAFSLDNAGIILGRAATPGGSSEPDQAYTGQTVAQLISGAVVTAFTDIARSHTGTFASSTYTAVNREQHLLSPEDALVEAIGRTVKGIAGAIGEAVVVLTHGAMSIEEVNKILADLPIEAMSISFADLKGDALMEALQSVFSQLGDTMVGAILQPGNMEALEDFQQVGEGAFETLIRVASGVERATAVLDQWGIQIIDWQDIVNTQGDVTTELIRGSIVAAQTVNGVTSSIGRLIKGFDGSADDIIGLYKTLQNLSVLLRATAINTDMLTQAMITGAGGLDALRSALDVYADKFFTDAEKAAAAQKELASGFAALGAEVPGTRAALRAMIEAAQAAGDDRLVGQLLKLVPAFERVTSATEQMVNRVSDAAAAAAGITVSDVADAAKTAAEAWLDKMKAVFSGEDYATNQANIAAAIASKIASARANLTAVEDTHRRSDGSVADMNIYGQYYSDLIDARKQLEEYQKMLGIVGKDMERYFKLEAESPGRGKQLMDLEDWYSQQKSVVGSNQAALLALEEIYQRKRKELVQGSVEGLKGFLQSLLTGPLSTLTDEGKLEQLKNEYESALKSGDNAQIQASAQAYLQMAREMYASSPAYNAIFTKIFDEINAATGNTVAAPWQTAIETAMPQSSPIASQENILKLGDVIVETMTASIEASVEAMQQMTEQVKADNALTRGALTGQPFGT